MTPKPSLAFFSPLPPVRSGISDYSKELLPYLASHFQITLFVAQEDVELSGLDSFEIRRIKSFRKLHRSKGYDYLLYQMGNGLDHEAIYETALRFPGVVVLHDFILHHFIAGITLDRGNYKAYEAELCHEYGEKEGKQLAQRMVAPGTSAQDRFRLFMEHPLNRKLLERSLGVICHSHYVERLIRERVPDKPVQHIPMGIVIPEDHSLDKAQARSVLGLNADEFIVASFGRITPSKRLEPALRSFARFRQQYPRSRYLLVGESEPDYPIESILKSMALQDSVQLVGFSTLDDFHRYIQAADVCLNLRYPTAGETSAGLLRIMAAGKPVLVSDCGSFSELPDSVALKVPVGHQGREEELIFRYLTLLAQQPAVAVEIGKNTRELIVREHRLDVAASRYHEFLTSVGCGSSGTAAACVPDLALREGKLPSVYVVVLNYNGAKHIDVCLQSLLEQSYPNTHILMVDNASPDGSGEYAQKKYPQVQSILCADNLGFARGNNLGFDHVLAQGADYIVALNNDVEVDRDWVARQVEVMESDPGIGACGSRLLSYWQRDIVNSLGHEMNQWGHVWDIGFGRRFDPVRWGNQQDIVSICGCSFMIRREVLEKVKGFDPRYFAYYDDVDLSVRIRGLGYRLVYVPEAIVYHKFSASFGHESPRKLALCTVNKWRFLFSHLPFWKIISIFPRQIKRDAREALRLLRLGESRNTEVLLKAFWQFAKMLPGLVLYRLKNRWRKQHYDFLKMCAPTNQVPHFFAPRQDYELLAEKSEQVPSRIIMGYSDDYLGEGWFPAESGYYTEGVRWMSKRASVFLKASGGAKRNHFFQAHVRCPNAFLSASAQAGARPFPTLTIYVEGERIDEFPVGTDWRTIQFPLWDGLPEVVRVEFDAEPLFTAEQTGDLRDVTMQFDEISLLEERSPLIRRVVTAASAGADGRAVASSISPSVLKADICLDEFPLKSLIPGMSFEIAVTVRNIGDTCWLAQPLTGGGYVTLGIQLLDENGGLMNPDFGRQLLPETMLPGSSAELSVALKAPSRAGQYRIKVDMVDEGLCWFEQQGSQSVVFAMDVAEMGVRV